jgi:hypothetical protein
LCSSSGLILHEKLNYRNEAFPVVNFYREKSAVSHSITPRDTLEVSPVKIPGATAFETSGNFLINYLMKNLIVCTVDVDIRQDVLGLRSSILE